MRDGMPLTARRDKDNEVLHGQERTGQPAKGGAGRTPAGRATGSGQLALSGGGPSQPSRYLGSASTTSITRCRYDKCIVGHGASGRCPLPAVTHAADRARQNF